MYRGRAWCAMRMAKGKGSRVTLEGNVQMRRLLAFVLENTDSYK